MSLLKAASMKSSRTNKAKEEALKDVQAQPMKQLNVQIPEEALHRLKVKATMEKTTVSKLVNEWVSRYIET